MREWFDTPTNHVEAIGDYSRWGFDFDDATDQAAFLERFGKAIRDIYLAPLRLLAEGTSLPIDLTKAAARLTGHTDLLMTFGAEVLATWADAAFFGRWPALAPAAHESRPAFDSITVGTDGVGLYVCMIQAKATQDNIGRNANTAAIKLGRLDRGDFQLELASALEMIALRSSDGETRKALLRALADPGRRRYLVAVLHEAPSPGAVLTNYAVHITGDQSRRNAAFIRCNPWLSTWTSIRGFL